MTNLILFILLLIPIDNPWVLQQHNQSDSTEDRGDFELTIENIPREKGEIRIAIFDSEESYNSKEDPVFAIVLPVEGKSLNWSETGLPFGNYAIAVYHDKNKNGKLDTNFLGIPKEAYGFSNDARGKFGPASWKDAHFEMNEKSVSHTIKIK